MANPKQDKQFNETLRRMMKSPPKEHKDMKKGRKPKQAPDKGHNVTDE